MSNVNINININTKINTEINERYYLSNLKKFELEFEETSELLGEGSYSIVVLGKSKLNNIEYAIKKINREWIDNKDIEIIKNEIKILSEVNHENIIKFYGHYYDENFIYIVMEKGLSLENLLNKGCLEEKIVKKYSKDIFNGLLYLKQNKIIHCDIKIPNIIIINEVAKICDFGLSEKIEGGDIKIFNDNNDNNNNMFVKKSSIKGSSNYIAPELFTIGDLSYQVDIWSCGILILKLITNYYLRNYNTSELYLYFRHSNVSNELIELIKSMLILDYKERNTIEDLINHNWFKS